MSATPMKTDKKVFWFSRARSDGYLVCVIGALLLLLLGTVGLRFWLNTRFDDQIRAVRGQVLAARRCIQLFSEINGRLPESLEEFRRWWHEEDTRSIRKMYVDLLSDRREDVSEYRELNDRGGYFYDPRTGEIRLNLMRTVKEYLPWWYSGAFKNEIPSSW